ncbi:YqiA/YcfP family alpha/beta fold hydrolase [Undibacterium fentianense]|uniref:Esterase n=1 Tax=Undibacterium fentianense TaxID=2828728 RepID=A0A941E1P0_9BURK|nr:YqiA/YcfP family alpha/beta fold hydrolase [Undibacterium fentianense]MBR7799346.1 esterase [Undibacterium fentianense]
MILYLHGFRSSPASYKAQVLAAHFLALGRNNEFACPQLPASPKLAIELAQTLIDEKPLEKCTIIGSSLGGYYANFLAEKNDCKAILLNPAVKPPRDLEKYVGMQTAYHSEELFEFKEEYLEELKQFEVEQITLPKRYLLIAATGDEVLDWREMQMHYAQAQQLIIQGSDHGISEFPDYLEQILAFCDADK